MTQIAAPVFRTNEDAIRLFSYLGFIHEDSQATDMPREESLSACIRCPLKAEGTTNRDKTWLSLIGLQIAD
jgi:hypothetical protein